MENLSGFEALPTEILNLIIDKLAYYQFYNLGIVNKFFYNLTLASESFWTHRLLIDLNQNDFTNPQNRKESYRYRLGYLKESLDILSRIKQTSLSINFLQKYIDELRQILQCHVPHGLSKILIFIEDVLDSYINVRPLDQSVLKSSTDLFIDFLVQMDGVWSNSNICDISDTPVPISKFYKTFIWTCIKHSRFDDMKTIINKFEVSHRPMMGVYLLEAYPIRNDASVLQSVFRFGLDLIGTKVDNMLILVEKGYFKLLAQVIVIYKVGANVSFDQNVHKNLKDMIVDELLTIIAKMDYVFAMAIYRKIVLFCDLFPLALDWFLNCPLIPVLDLDSIIMYLADLPFQHDRLAYKKVLQDYIRRHPECISEKGYQQIENFERLSSYK